MPDTKKPRVALIEDDEDLRETLQAGLAELGYPVWGVGSAEAMYKRLIAEPVDVAVMDIGLPGESGYEAVRHLATHTQVAVVILSGRRAAVDKRLGLEFGADRFLTKPIDLFELAANIDAADRGNARKGKDAAPGWRLMSAGWRLLTEGGTAIELSSGEWQFLRCLAQAPERTATRDQIAEALSGKPGAPGFDQRRIDMLVSRLRTKARNEARIELPVKTVFGKGFTLTVDLELH